MLRSIGVFLVLALALVGCGKKSEVSKGKDDAAVPQVAPLSAPPSGVEAIKKMGFVWDVGTTAYDKAVAALKAKQWSAVRTNAEAAIAKDPTHLDAHRLLASALAREGEHAAAVDHLVTALAADYWKYGPGLAKDDELKDLMGTSHGAAVTALAAKLRDDYQKRTASGLWLVGRRSAFKWPKDPGVQGATSRGEVYAFDRETKRYLRLTHTDHKVAGFVRAPSGAEIAIIGFDKIDKPKTDDEPPTFAGAWLQVIETTEWKPVGAKIKLDAAREISVGYGAGDQLLVSTAPASGRWGIGAVTVASIDKTTGKATKVATPPPVPRVVLTLDEGKLVTQTDAVTATWTGDPPTAPSIKTTGATIAVPESGAASQASLAVAPGGARIVFATAVDPCAKDTAPSLYVADAKTGALKHVLTAASRFATRWIDATTLAYEDGDGAIRLWDATTSRELMRLDNKAGIALDVLSLASAPLCKQAPPAVDAGSGSGDEPLPPEEGPGPITAPQ
jgi:hypothetical protein